MHHSSKVDNVGSSPTKGDDTREHRAYYLYHLNADPSIKIDYQGSMGDGIYLIRIIKLADYSRV